MRVLMIGGTGLISTAITRQCLARGDRVVHFNRGQRERRFEGEVESLLGDRRDYPAFEAAIRAAGPFDAVIEMIGFHAPDAESLLRACRGATGHLAFCSTVDVYRKPATRYPITEAEPYGPLNAYGRGKVDCERILTGQDELPVTILRPAHTYGEGGSVLGTFGWQSPYLDRVRKGKPIVVHGDGQSLWVSCHVDDVARAFLGALDNPAARGQAYHVAGEEWLTWNRYHELVAEAMKVPLPRLVQIPADVLVRLEPRRAASVADNFQFDNIFDNAAARGDLGFRYTVPFVEGVGRAIRWLDDHGRIADGGDDDFEDRLIAAWDRHIAALAAELES